LYRIIRERVSLPDQGKAVGVMASAIPPDRNPEFIAWMFPLLGDDDRENMTRVWRMVMPAEVFAGAIQLVHRAVGNGCGSLDYRSARTENALRRSCRPVPLNVNREALCDDWAGWPSWEACWRKRRAMDLCRHRPQTSSSQGRSPTFKRREISSSGTCSAPAARRIAGPT
jgi:hypothetical protein